MFTGIVEQLGTIISIHKSGTNMHIELTCPFVHELRVEQSLLHNGVCLTVTSVTEQNYFVTAIEETLLKTNLGELQPHDKVNLERAMPAHGRFDGHIVQGHVDTTAICHNIEERAGSWIYSFRYDIEYSDLLVEKGSVCVNGVSLTVVNCCQGIFSVAIIPYTYSHTTFQYLKPGSTVNIEFDIVGKYIKKIYSRYK